MLDNLRIISLFVCIVFMFYMLQDLFKCRRPLLHTVTLFLNDVHVFLTRASLFEIVLPLANERSSSFTFESNILMYGE